MGKGNDVGMLASLMMTAIIIAIICWFLIKWVLILLIVVIISIITYVKKRKPKIKFENIEEELAKIDCMDGVAFEQYIANLLRANNYTRVNIISCSNDYGADIIATFKGSRYAIQCKCCSSAVGIKAIQEVTYARIHYRTEQAIVFTNSTFASNAKRVAEENDVQLWDRDQLRLLLNSAVLKRNSSKEKNKTKVKESHGELCTTNHSNIYEEVKNKTRMIHGNNNSIGCNNHLIVEEEKLFMATQIGAGKYIFDEDIPLGKYNLKAISGNGMLIIQTSEEEDGEKWLNFGVREDFAREYRNLSLPKGWYFTLDGNLNVQITKSEMLKID